MYAGFHPDSALADLPLVSTASDESDLSPIVRRARPRVPTPGAAVLLRAALAFMTFAAIGALAIPAMAEPGMQPSETQKTQPRLRGDVTARGDVLALADLVEGAPDFLAARPLFRSPALGATGTIQTRRIVEAAAALGLTGIETGGRMQIAVQRAARRLGPPELEAALKRGLESGYGLDPRNVAVRFDGDGPTLLAPVDLAGQAAALDLTYDPRSRRVSGLVSLGERQASLRVSGVVIELREVAVLTRALNRGDPVRESDLVVERRPREAVASDAQAGASTVVGEVAQHALPAGSVLRVSDTALPELVARGESVTIVYETASVSLSMRGLANEAGRMGAVVNVVNVASKKVLQATVIGPGRVSVGPGPVAQQAAAAPQVQATASLR
ncbi:flagellar basal body P-ring formation chaperone FlgA [Methylobacterium pseudosasicola]|uniref:Flagella basal body P-ring formation protein FlgA n=1 Tax=Methylobacterium pseudosasicola TaxID=582667 RepID=A0A1I4IAA9_9HYPH|nr:flagellar basal body P-ring formation chaperone FlgA [Methylobacterium pseudosasicola]SFL51027.1 flagella basal body P-ring formation protein FlgA [Methylobacterium pseudosasicola]